MSEDPVITIVYGFASAKDDNTDWDSAPNLPAEWDWESEGDGDGCECTELDEHGKCKICKDSGFGVNNYFVYGHSTRNMKQAVVLIRTFFDDQVKKGNVMGYKLEFTIDGKEAEENQIPSH
jgi:hypothetical protein